MTIPFLDLVPSHAALKRELVKVFEAALETAAFIGGPMVEAFEADFASFCGVRHCVGVGSGTDALRLALIAAGIGAGDSVVTVPNTFIATTEAISQSGAQIVFVDIDEQTYNIDPEKLSEYLLLHCDRGANGTLVDRRTRTRVKAVIPVHLYGQMAHMDRILDLTEKNGLIVIEDACQAHGAEYFSPKNNRWCKSGSMGIAAAFSFYPGKNLGACGEAGAVTTNDRTLAERIRMLRDHGQAQKYYHNIEGYNGRLDSIQAGILRVKLKCLGMWTDQRRAAASRYRELFEGEPAVKLPFVPAWSKPVYHLFVIRVDNREKCIRELRSAGIGTGIHYPIPLHLQKAYSNLGYRKGDFPVAERAADDVLSLPMFPDLTREQQDFVASNITSLISAIGTA